MLELQKRKVVKRGETGKTTSVSATASSSFNTKGNNKESSGVGLVCTVPHIVLMTVTIYLH